MFDVRFIPNPYYIDSMKKLNGLNEPVRDYVLEWTQTQNFIEKLMDMLMFLFPNYKKEGKNQVVVGIGCTGGRHRSVAISEKIKELLKENEYRVTLLHRDIQKDNRRKEDEV